MTGADDLAQLLTGTPLGGRPVEDLGADRLMVRIEPDDVWPSWQAARALVDVSGRWPVAVMGYGQDPPGFDLAWPDFVAGTIGQAAGIADPFDAWKESWRDMPLTEDWLEALVSSFGLTPAQARDLVDREAVLSDAARMRLDRRLAEVGGDAARLEVSEYLTERDKLWFAPTFGEAVGIAFLPTADPVEAAAHLSYFGGGGPDLVAVVREWHARWGVEPVAAWTTMLQFVAARRPSTLDDAWELAGQQLRMAGNVNAEQDELALALMRTDYWFLHERP